MTQLTRRDGSVIHEGEGTLREVVLEAYNRGLNLRRSNLRGSDLRGSNLSGSDLSCSNLSRSNLRGSDLRCSNLSGACLSGACLSGACLSRATGILAEYCTPLLMLLDQPGPIHAYKLVTADGVGPFNGGITYQIGETCEVPNANTDPSIQCAAGINVATLDWCLQAWEPGRRVLIVEFTAEDIAAIPTSTDGKFRLHRCRVVGEKDLTGLVPAAAAETTDGSEGR